MRWKRRWTPLRPAVQGAVALLYLLLPWLNRGGFRAVSGNLASLKRGPVDLVEPAAGVLALLASKSWSWGLALGMALPLLLALALGPVFCSWVCPWGLFSEALDSFKLRVLKLRSSWSAQGYRGLFWVRLAVLFAFLAGSWALAVPLVAWLAPPRLLTALPQELFYLRVPPTLTGTLLLLWLAAELLGRRLVCRALCPVGSLWNLLRTPWTLAVRFQTALCVDPQLAPCHLHCPFGIDPRRMGRFAGCTNCLRCLEGCPSGALQARPAAPRLPVHPHAPGSGTRSAS